MRLHFAALAPLIFLGACSTYSYGSVSDGATTVREAKSPDSIVLTEKDGEGRYESLGDISVTVNKTTILNKDPTREDIDAELRKRAAALGADAVVLVRYGTVGIGAISWGSLDGKGRAIAFRK